VRFKTYPTIVYPLQFHAKQAKNSVQVLIDLQSSSLLLEAQ